MKIPKEFTVGGRTYKITMYETSKDIDDNLGDFSDILQEIRLAKSTFYGDNAVLLSEDLLNEVYWHEVGHCFGTYYKDDHSEEFACAFSHFMVEYFKSLKE